MPAMRVIDRRHYLGCLLAAALAPQRLQSRGEPRVMGPPWQAETKIDPATLPQNVACWAVVAWLAAQSSQRFGAPAV
ncbi:MAG: hypothetical protein RLZ81_2493 [Pseudomonadota bacterium]|jgi:hypothetical protein